VVSCNDVVCGAMMSYIVHDVVCGAIMSYVLQYYVVCGAMMEQCCHCQLAATTVVLVYGYVISKISPQKQIGQDAASGSTLLQYRACYLLRVDRELLLQDLVLLYSKPPKPPQQDDFGKKTSHDQIGGWL